MNQQDTVKLEIIKLLDAGEKNKQQIYTKVVENLGVPRATVRRVARSLAIELRQKVQFLNILEQKEGV